MKIAIAGAHGQIGSQLARMLAGGGHEVAGIIRNPDQSDDIRETGAEPVVCDLEHAQAEEIRAAVRDADAVVFAAGAGPGSGPERKKTVDRDGAIKLAHAFEEEGGGHFVVVSSMGADPQASEGDMAAYQRAKGEADEAVRASGLTHTIVRPGRLTDDPGTGKVKAGTDVGRGDIPREDVAAVIATIIERGAPADATIELVSGSDPIAEALKTL